MRSTLQTKLCHFYLKSSTLSAEVEASYTLWAGVVILYQYPSVQGQSTLRSTKLNMHSREVLYTVGGTQEIVLIFRA